MKDDKELSTQEKAIAHLASNDIQAYSSGGSVYVHVGYDIQLEISDDEVNYQAELYDEVDDEEQKEDDDDERFFLWDKPKAN